MNSSGNFAANVLKGVAIGTANVIPGVSGGTMAVITGVFAKLIESVKSFNLTALRLLVNRNFEGLQKQIDFRFVFSIAIGMAIAVLSMARLFGFLFREYPVFVWAFFFGLIAPSVYYVSKNIGKWSVLVAVAFLFGTVAALGLSFMTPSVENGSFAYVFLCGVVSISAMILPGISGSFVLILMGNYQLIVLKSISEMNFSILVPFALGCGAGLVAFANLLSFVLRKFKDVTMASLTGFVAGSLIFVWPWKNPVYALDSAGQIIQRKGENLVLKYERVIPILNSETLLALAIAIIGALIVVLMEKWAAKEPSLPTTSE